MLSLPSATSPFIKHRLSRSLFLLNKKKVIVSAEILDVYFIISETYP